MNTIATQKETFLDTNFKPIGVTTLHSSKNSRTPVTKQFLHLHSFSFVYFFLAEALD
ncbi:hypothetical protein NIES2104_21610 [Leptolyngbya sp. NIES-2104]|nr:hypothetical protein NIES2104_21610 [Leptolyngbya sp. NIES-2104]